MSSTQAQKLGLIAMPRPWYRRYPVAAFLVSLILAFVTSPFEEAFRDGDLVEWVIFDV